MRSRSGMVVLCWLAGWATGWCQSGMASARALALAGAYEAAVTGVEAGLWNPANLGLKHTPGFSLALGTVGLDLYNNAFARRHYELYNGATLSTADKATILQAIPAAGLRFNLAGKIHLLGMSAGNVAVNIAVEGQSEGNLSRDFVDLLLTGNRLDRRYDFSATSGSGVAFLTVELATGHAIRLKRRSRLFKKLTFGVAAKYVRGLATAEVLHAQGSMITTLQGLSGDGYALVRTAAGGNGAAFDFGVTGIVSRRLALALVFRNFPGVINWDNSVKLYTYGVVTDTSSLRDWTTGDSLYQTYSKRTSGSNFVSVLPASLSLGLAHYWSQMMLTATLAQGLSRRFGGTTPELRLGIEFMPAGFFQPRFGVRAGGRGLGVTTGIGLRAGALNLDVAAGTWQSLLPTNSKGLVLAFGLRFES